MGVDLRSPIGMAATRLTAAVFAVLANFRDAHHRIHGSVFFDPFGKTIGHKIQPDVMFQECFQAGEHQRKSLR